MPQQQQRPLAKRSACDRCREHKLRCLRSQGQADEPCVRCARAGASCVTGAPRPLGRSRINHNDAPQQHGSRKSRHSVFVSVTVPKSTPKGSPAVVPEPDHESETTTESAAQELTSPPTHGSDSFECFPDPLAMNTDFSSMLFEERVSGSETEHAVADALDLGFPRNAACSDYVSGPNPGAFAMDAYLPGLHDGEQPTSKSLLALSGTNDLGFGVDPDFLLPSLPGGALDLGNRMPQPSLGSSNALAQLARLNESIARQLSQMDAFVLSIPPPDLTHSCVDKAADLQVNPILRALESTSELAAIVKQIISPIQDHDASPFNIPVILMCLSGHIQLLQIYNSIFLHVYRFLSGLDDILGFFENLPGFTHISGLPTIKGDLYIKIIVQVTQHNISSVERHIGLPAELCLSAERTSCKSLLSHLDSPDLFQNIMNQACNPSEKSGRALVETLRTRIGNVLGLLRDDY
ncbi:hypothetical protein CSAL01_10634 [Colletotrichum salicis]|uniref:Zn(2)-C6 fungal-type domain-containing protein n=1 Tax=Colletotrichum salicis TaxID=1209931 RepID=A0A135U6V1_9PEZI|nr:hypothetical protein CSAL01_10634 [Colletotrichum salicis]